MSERTNWYVAENKRLRARAEAAERRLAAAEDALKTYHRALYDISVCKPSGTWHEIANQLCGIAKRALASVRSVQPDPQYVDLATPVTEGLLEHRPVTDEETDAVIKRAIERESEFYRPVREGDDT